MADFPTKPKGVEEHDWYRQLEREIDLTVISVDHAEGRCPHCSERRLIFHSQVYPSRQIVSACKTCLSARAAAPERIWVRTEEHLRRKWRRGAKGAAPPQLRKRCAPTETRVPGS